MSGSVDPSAFRVKVPLRGFTKKTLADVVIPAGSMVEWQPGNYAGGLANVLWRGRPFLVIEGELFKYCERLAESSALRL
jgi:hypothetical protein